MIEVKADARWARDTSSRMPSTEEGAIHCKGLHTGLLQLSKDLKGKPTKQAWLCRGRTLSGRQNFVSPQPKTIEVSGQLLQTLLYNFLPTQV